MQNYIYKKKGVTLELEELVMAEITTEILGTWCQSFILLFSLLRIGSSMNSHNINVHVQNTVQYARQYAKYMVKKTRGARDSL